MTEYSKRFLMGDLAILAMKAVKVYLRSVSGAASSLEAVNTFRPSGNVTRPPEALLEPSRARKPSTLITDPSSRTSSGDASSHEDTWRCGRKAPRRHLSISTVNIDIKPDMRVRPLHLRDRSGHADGLGSIEHSYKRVMGPEGRRCRDETYPENTTEVSWLLILPFNGRIRSTDPC